MDRRCPTCRTPVPDDAPQFPFCGERCRMADLGGWLDEKFRIGGSDEEDGQSEPEETS